MPGTLLPMSTADPRWKGKLCLQLWVLAEGDKSQVPASRLKLPEVLAAASKDLAEGAGELEATEGSDRKNAVL